MNAILLCQILLAGSHEPNVASRAVNEMQFLRFVDVAGEVHCLTGGGQAGSALVFLSANAGESAGAIETLNRVVEATPKEKVEVLGVVPNGKRHRSEVAAFAQTSGAKFPIVFDTTGDLVALLSPSATPAAYLIDRGGDIVYRGGLEGGDFANAVTALAEGKPIAVGRTNVVGPGVDPSMKDPAVTYTRHIAGILHANCGECHRPGQVAPFSLLNYEEVAKRASFLAEVTKGRMMPPWKAEVGYGHFEGERRLTERQIALIEAWSKAGGPEGDKRDMPVAPRFPEGWRLGTPDLVVEAPVPYSVPADGPDIFQHFVMPVNLPDDKTLIGFEYRPSNPKVAHHAVVFLDTSGQARALDEETPEPGYRTSGSVGGGVTAMVGVWTPGMTPRFYPEGIGIQMSRKVDVVLQMHLHPSGKPEVEQSKLAFYFSDKPSKEVRRQEMLLLGSLAIDIPAGRDQHAIGSTFTLPIDATLLSVFPHLHLIGKSMKVTATLPGGEARPLIWIKDWNFYWQDQYMYHEPIRLPKGTKIKVEASYNNSAENPMNPSNPPRRVLFGNGSTDEMCFAFFQIVTDERQAMMRIAPALMQSFMSEWRKADIDEEAREHIVDEAGKLFGRRSTEMLRGMLLKPKKPTSG